ncbi:hypothetical protein [Asticcacaulis sp. EMRT-3]|uniref:hypothetical protein n=1 Tax=Asticcacaulis sp. EMRT-3 TaxID=3040349 RepID=UPI0024AFAAD1|nr:hypothetical protein [Asticcacaulis sp. EMRT-3]MDI7774683.1 hypothetical protein [Asticcacaulis sp. EMRT-3]
MSQAQTQMLMAALSMAAQVATQKIGADVNRQEMAFAVEQLAHERGLFDTKAGIMRDLIGALVEKRIDAVKSGFDAVLSLYAEQARHFMEQQRSYADAELATTDPLMSARLRKRLGETDIELRSIRSSARQLYGQMNEIILRLGGEALTISPDFAMTLSLPRGM